MYIQLYTKIAFFFIINMIYEIKKGSSTRKVLYMHMFIERYKGVKQCYRAAFFDSVSLFYVFYTL